MEIMDYLTKERSQDIIITSVRSLLVDTTDFHQNNFSFPLKICMAAGIVEASLSLVYDTTSTFWVNSPEQNSGILLQQKQEIMLNYLLMNRSEEELEMLKEDMANIIRYFIYRFSYIIVHFFMYRY